MTALVGRPRLFSSVKPVSGMTRRSLRDCRDERVPVRVSRTGNQVGTDTAKQHYSHIWRVQMRCRFSAVIAALALAQLLLGGVVPSCPLLRGPSHGTPVRRAHSAAGMSCQTGDTRASAGVPSKSGTPLCDSSAQDACVGMTSCTAVITSAAPEHFAAGLGPDQVGPRVLGLRSGPNRSPEPPPPRI